MFLDTRTKLFVALSAVFVTALVIGDLIGGKLVEVQLFGLPLVMSVGMIPFPVTFLLTDILNEFYGKSAARFITVVGFFMALFAYATIFSAMLFPWAPFTREAGYEGMVEGSFNNVFVGSQRILVASMIAYLAGQFVDIAVFNAIKRATGGKMLWLRATGSTLVSQFLDTFVIQLIAWWGVLSVGQLLSLTFTAYVVKIVAAIGLTPLVYAGHAIVEGKLGIRPVALDAQGQPSPQPSLASLDGG